ncbi:MAG: hypothetical protein HRU26_16675, partial [Psychroserpens sp.]|nr:hypothetical protein [Psychroserpens sp.]
MIKKLLLLFLLCAISGFLQAQVPGSDCSSATPLNLVVGGTITTGLQSTAGLGNNYDGTVNCGQAGFY